MVSRLDSQMIPTRFLMTMAHFIAVLMVFYTKQDNILNSMSVGYTSGAYKEATSSVLAACWLSIICFVIEFVGLLMGVSMFMVTLNGFGQSSGRRAAARSTLVLALCVLMVARLVWRADIVCHFIGCILVSWYIVDSWYFTTIWYMFVFFKSVDSEGDTRTGEAAPRRGRTRSPLLPCFCRSLLPALFEVVAFIRVFCCRVVAY